MSRLPPRPELSFRDDGTPVATAHGDVYFSAHDGLEETRAVFLKGCRLPDAWADRDRFCVAELGFGTGLNFLALWDSWLQSRPNPLARLDFVSFEGFPLDAAQARRALSRWPELAPLAEKLLARWPVRMRGIQHVHWSEDGISLTLHQGEVAQELPRARFTADAWFLDGFSPAKNADMWSDEVLRAVAARSRVGSRAATFTVAGAVRRSLEAAGFRVAKAPGYGRKRERLEAVLEVAPTRNPDVFGLNGPDSRPHQIAIIGAGIAGATLAWMARQAGLAPVVFDRAGSVAAGASGNPLGLVHARLDAADTAAARIHLQAGAAAARLYACFPDACFPVRVERLAGDDREAARFAKLLADSPVEGLEGEGGKMNQPGGLIVRPTALVAQLLDGVDTRLGADAEVDGSTVNREAFDAVIFAHAMGAKAQGLSLDPRQGQVESLTHQTERFAITRSNYAISDGETLVFGATFTSGDDEGPNAGAQAENLACLAEIRPDLAEMARSRALESRSSVRATTPDRLPVVGAVPDWAGAARVLAPLSSGGRPEEDLPVRTGQFVLSGLGSRGFTLAPLMAEMLVAQLTGAPSPVSQPEGEALAPVRFLVRDMKRGLG